jgi:hypothetical protein
LQFRYAVRVSWPGVAELGAFGDMTRMKVFRGLLLAAVLLYVAAFVVIHRSSSLRRPAANMVYWYYSDSPVLEAVEFYGFWPLRQIGYRIPGFSSRHYFEHTPFESPPDLEEGA